MQSVCLGGITHRGYLTAVPPPPPLKMAKMFRRSGPHFVPKTLEFFFVAHGTPGRKFFSKIPHIHV